jgi:hypothetical protein
LRPRPQFRPTCSIERAKPTFVFVFVRTFPCEVLLMPRALCLTTVLFLVPLGSASADGPPDRGGNAALKYWQAFAALPHLTDAEQKKLNAASLTKPPDARDRELVAKAEYALQMLHRGAALRRCDWGTDYEEGIYVRTPHADAARVLCSLACLRARLRFGEGKSAAAVEDLVEALTLSRHVSQDGVLILTLHGYAIEHRVGETLALELPRLDDAAVKNLKARLDALPPGGSPAAGMRAEEKACLDWLVRSVKAAKDEDGLLTLLMPLFLSEKEDKGGDLRAKARDFLRACGGTAAGILQRAEETRSSYARVAKMFDLPAGQFEKAFADEKAKRAGNPVFQVFFPAAEHVRRSQERAAVRRALLAAALAVRLNGRAALKRHPDPVVGGAFDYVAFAGGFELRSNFKGQDGHPVTLTVGRRGQ